MSWSSILEGLGDVTGYMPWQIEDFTDNVVSGAGNLLDLGGQAFNLINTSSADKKRAQTPQFARIPIEQVLADFDQYRNWLSRNMTPITLPTRRMTTTEMNDPIFGNQGMAGLQAFADERARQVAQREAKQTPGKPEAGVDSVAPAIQRASAQQQEPRTIGLSTLPDGREMYTDPMGIMYTGPQARTLAENAALAADATELARDTGRVKNDAQATIFSNQLGGAVQKRGAEYTNPYTGHVYSREAMRDAIRRGDINDVFVQRNTATYDPTPGFLGKISPLLKAGALAAFTGGAAAGLAPALGITSSIGTKALGTGLDQALTRTMQ